LVHRAKHEPATEAQIFPTALAGTEAAVESILERMAATLVIEARDVRETASACVVGSSIRPERKAEPSRLASALRGA
jgi:hypothetical protein